MRLLTSLLTSAGLLVQSSAFATMNHPEEAYPEDIPPLASPEGPYQEFFQKIQERLIEEGFDAGPVNGNFTIKTQAALAQFQLAHDLPASGTTDAETLLALGVERPARP